MIKRLAKTGALLIAFLLAAGVSAYLTVTLIVKSEDTVVVPDLIGKDVVYVLKILTDLRLNTKVKGFEYHDAVSMNRIVYQEPEPGAEIKRGRDVRIILSKGSPAVPMPNLVGLSLQQARIILDENGLSPGAMSATYSSVANKDEVIAQVPPAGVTIARSARVDLLTSLGIRPNAYKMPVLIGRPLEEAILLIEKSQLLTGAIRTVSMGGKPVHAVVGQEPSPGRRVFEGAAVNLEVNAGGAKKEGVVFEDGGGVRLYRYRAENGFIRERIAIRLGWFGFSADLFDGFVGPGREIWVLIPESQDVLLSLYKNRELAENRFFPAWQPPADEFSGTFAINAMGENP